MLGQFYHVGSSCFLLNPFQNIIQHSFVCSWQLTLVLQKPKNTKACHLIQSSACSFHHPSSQHTYSCHSCLCHCKLSTLFLDCKSFTVRQLLNIPKAAPLYYIVCWQRHFISLTHSNIK